MKMKRLSVLLLALLMLLSMFTACGGDSAEDPAVDDVAVVDTDETGTEPEVKEFVYKLVKDRDHQVRTVGEWKIAVVDDNQEAAITGYYGEASEVVVPAELDGFPVTMIGEFAFSASDNPNITSVTLPETIFAIEKGAFKGQSKLETIQLPANLKYLGESVFYDCESLTELVIPEGFTQIPAMLCASCTSLSSVTIPASTKVISSRAFARTSLESVELPEGLEKIEESAFTETKIRELVIPASVNFIAKHALWNTTLYKISISSADIVLLDGFMNPNVEGLEIICEKDSPAFEYAKQKEIMYRYFS